MDFGSRFIEGNLSLLGFLKKIKCKFWNDICVVIDEIEVMNMKKGYFCFLWLKYIIIFFFLIGIIWWVRRCIGNIWRFFKNIWIILNYYF